MRSKGNGGRDKALSHRIVATLSWMSVGHLENVYSYKIPLNFGCVFDQITQIGQPEICYGKHMNRACFNSCANSNIPFS